METKKNNMPDKKPVPSISLKQMLERREAFHKTWCYRYIYCWWYPVRRFIIHWVTCWHKELKWFIQRRVRGYDDSDMWDLYSYLGNHIVKCLKQFIKGGGCSYPSRMKGIDEWHKEIQDMIDGFDFLANHDDDKHDPWELGMSIEEFKKYTEFRDKQFKEATEKAHKFIDSFGDLWD